MRLLGALEAFRRWGVNYLTDPGADGVGLQLYDVHYVEGIEALEDGDYGLVIDGTPSTLRFAGGVLEHSLGQPANPALVVSTSSAFMVRWAAGASTWDDGLVSGEVVAIGPSENWNRWQAATGYLLVYEPEEGRT